jgi:ABC-type spermidine/putrescine transport system permease subunit II
MATTEDYREKLNAMPEDEFGDFRRRLGSEHQGKDRNQILDVIRFNAKKTFSEDFLCEILGLQTEYQKLVTASINSAKAALMAAEASVKSAVAGEIAGRSAERSARAAEKAVILMVASVVVATVALGVSLYSALK